MRQCCCHVFIKLLEDTPQASPRSLSPRGPYDSLANWMRAQLMRQRYCEMLCVNYGVVGYNYSRNISSVFDHFVSRYVLIIIII